MWTLLLIPLVASLQWIDFTDEEKEAMFKTWASEFNRTYANEEYDLRKNVFLTNAEKIFQVNSEPGLTYQLGVNQFADMTATEFREHIHGGSHGYCLHPSWKTRSWSSRLMMLREKLGFSQHKPKEQVSAPADSVDWTTKGVVTKVKNQGQCGSCWAFSTTGAVESAVAIQSGKLVSLSEQELVDCSKSYGNQGCQGGLMDDAFKYVKAKGGLCSETEYPYKGKNGACKQCSKRYDAIGGYQDVARDSEAGLEAAVAKQPVSVAVEADQLTFQFYKSGVMTGKCGTKLDHGVLVVGYGEESGSQFWKVKNSWGPTWGEQGYLKICRNCNKNRKAGECGILMQPSRPTV